MSYGCHIRCISQKKADNHINDVHYYEEGMGII